MGAGLGRWRALEEARNDVVERVDEPERQVGLDLGRDVDQVFLVVPGQEHLSMPAPRAARIFSRTPPTGKTRPVSVTSPVMARLATMGYRGTG